MIYAPQEVFNVRLAIARSLFAAITRFAVDYIIGENEDWSFYLGYGLGGAALATGIVDANAVMYVAGQGIVKLFFEKSPGAATVRLMLDGVLAADLDLSDELVDVTEHILNIPDDGLAHAILLVNLGTAVGIANPTNWLSLLAIEAPETITIQEKQTVMANTVAFRIQDSESNSPLQTTPIALPSGKTLAEYQTWIDAAAAELDAITDGQIVSIEMTLSMTIPAGLKSAPVAASSNERGGLITFNTSGTRAESVRIPAISRTIMSGEEFSLEDVAIDALIDRLTTATTAGTIRPVTPYGYNFVSARKGTKSFRK